MDTLPTFPESEPAAAPLAVPLVPVRDALQWEYRGLTRDMRSDGPPDEAELNALGSEGWELAGVVAASDVLHLFFKRPR